MSEGFGAFGKMPSLGDFFQLNAPNGFVRVWDEWLQNAMMTASTKLGEQWDDLYMSAPIWRFTLSAGLAGPSKVTGVLMPSVDRVGRRFPLALMASVQGEGPPALDHLRQTEAFEALEDLALSALDDDMSRERLESGLQDIILPQPHAYAVVRQGGGTMVMTQANPDDISRELAVGLLNTHGLRSPSVWTAVLDGSSRVLICDGLPGTLEIPALFDLSAPLWADARPI